MSDSFLLADVADVALVISCKLCGAEIALAPKDGKAPKLNSVQCPRCAGPTLVDASRIVDAYGCFLDSVGEEAVRIRVPSP